MVGMFIVILAVAAVIGGLTLLAIRLGQSKRRFAPTHRDAKGLGQAPFVPWRNGDDFLGYFRAASAPRRLVLFFHGGGGEALDRAWVSELVPEKDLLILVEYQGHGARPGRMDEASVLRDAERLTQLARAKWGELPMLAVGEGLGCTVAASLASNRSVDRLALIAPVVSVAAQWPAKEKFNSIPFLRAADVPVHMVQGTLDEFVPLAHGQAVFQAYAGNQKQFDEVPGFGHIGLDHAILHSPFTARFREFIAS